MDFFFKFHNESVRWRKTHVLAFLVVCGIFKIFDFWPFWLVPTITARDPLHRYVDAWQSQTMWMEKSKSFIPNVSETASSCVTRLDFKTRFLFPATSVTLQCFVQLEPNGQQDFGTVACPSQCTVLSDLARCINRVGKNSIYAFRHAGIPLDMQLIRYSSTYIMGSD